MARRTIFTDTFNRADGPIDAEVTSWSTTSNMPVISNNEAVNEYSNATGLSDVALPPDQWVEIVIGDPPPNRPECSVSCTIRWVVATRFSISVSASQISITKQPEDQYIFTQAYMPARGDVIRVEAQGSDIRLYANDALLTTENDPTPTDPQDPGIVSFALQNVSAPNSDGTIDEFRSGDFADDTSLSLGDVNGNNIIESNGTISITGTNLDTATSFTLTDGVNPYTLTTTNVTPTNVECAPVGIMDTQLPYGAMTVEATNGTDTPSQSVTLTNEPGWEYVVLASPNAAYLAEGLGAVDGDILEVEDAVGLSNLILFADSDLHFDKAVVDGTTFTRRFYDVSTATWDSGTGTINKTVEPGGTPPTWAGVPSSLPNATVGVPYSYAIGAHLQGDRPMTLTDVGTMLPDGLAYNDSVEPETIEGTPTESASLAGIVTRAENSV